MSNIPNNIFEQSESNAKSNIINNSNINQTGENEQNELKNLRIESSLSLRKKKLNQIIFSKRLKQINIHNNDNESDENNLYVSFKEIEKKVPYAFTSEFDLYEDKSSVIHQILNKDFTILQGLEYDEKSLVQYIIYKLTELSYYNKEFFKDTNEKDLKLIFYDIIKIINENNEKKIIFAATTILVNFIYSSKIMAEEFKKANIWKRLAEITDLKISDINESIALILSNYYSFCPEVGKEYILSNYSRHIKQILANFFKTFIEESKKENINLTLFLQGIKLIKLLIDENSELLKKTNDLDVVVKFKFLYDYLTKSFLIASSWIINNSISQNHESIYSFILNLLDLFNLIGKYADEEIYQMEDFRGESFASSICSLLKFLILNKEKEKSKEIILNIVLKLYQFIGILFSFGHDITEIYAQNKILNITEEFIQNINSMKIELVQKIIFFLSNYADSENRVKEIFEESNIATIIKIYINNTILDNNLCYNVFCLIENGFILGSSSSRELIIKNYTDFLIERIKILYNLIVQKETETPNKYIKEFLYKCELLMNFIIFLRKQTNNLPLLKDLLNYINISNVEEFIMNIRTYIKEEKKIDLIESLLKEIKNE